MMIRDRRGGSKEEEQAKMKPAQPDILPLHPATNVCLGEFVSTLRLRHTLYNY